MTEQQYEDRLTRALDEASRIEKQIDLTEHAKDNEEVARLADALVHAGDRAHAGT